MEGWYLCAQLTDHACGSIVILLKAHDREHINFPRKSYLHLGGLSSPNSVFWGEIDPKRLKWPILWYSNGADWVTALDAIILPPMTHQLRGYILV
jgi:hypothetical protein